MKLSKFDLKPKARMRMLYGLVRDLAFRGKIKVSCPRAKTVKRLFLKLQSLENRGHYDKVNGLLRVRKHLIKSGTIKAPFLTGRKLFSKAVGWRKGDSTKLTEVRVMNL